VRAEFGDNPFPDDEDKDGLRKGGLPAIQPNDMAANPKIF